MGEKESWAELNNDGVRVVGMQKGQETSVNGASSYLLILLIRPYSYEIPCHLDPSKTSKPGPGLFYENKCHKC